MSEFLTHTSPPISASTETVPIWIATILRRTGPTGVQTHYGEFIRHLQQSDYPCELVNSFAHSPWMLPAVALRRIIAKANGPASIRWHEASHEFFLKALLRRRLRHNKAVVLYAQCPISARAALEARASPYQRVVLAVHFNVSQAFEWAARGLIREGDSIWHNILAREHSVLTRVDGLVFVSEFLRTELARRVPGIERVPAALIPNFLRPQSSSPHRVSLPPTDLVAIGSLEPRKNQAYLLEIIAHANRSGTPISLTLIGDGADRTRLVSRANELGISRLVHFTGFIPDASTSLGCFRALIHVPRMENQGIVLIEAMSHGLPVFAPNIGGMGEVFEDGVEGWRVPLDHAAAAADIVVRNLAAPLRFQAAADAARQRFACRYDVALLGERLRRFLIYGEGRLN